ncbi:2Fe-2S ferredoxin-like superfamily protein, partial [Theobroma cacao]
IYTLEYRDLRVKGSSLDFTPLTLCIIQPLQVLDTCKSIQGGVNEGNELGKNLILSTTTNSSPTLKRASPRCPYQKGTMATLHFTPSPSFILNKPRPTTLATSQLNPRARHGSLRFSTVIARSYKVVIEHEGQSTELEVEPDETILSKALDSGLSVPHDCKLGVCMTCPAKLLSGEVDQSDGMLSDDVMERGFALLCAAYPRSDCHIKTIPEEELLSLQLATAND